MSSLAQPIYSKRYDYEANPVNTTDWTELIASLPQTAQLIDVFDGSGRAIALAVGAPGEEVQYVIIPPGGNTGPLPLFFASLSRISIKAIGANADSGELVVNLYKQ